MLLRRSFFLLAWSIVMFLVLKIGDASGYIICKAEEREALLSLKKGLVDMSGLFFPSWGVSEDCCQWDGVGCNYTTGHVDWLALGDIAGGTLSPSLLKLQQLVHLDLSGSDFHGSPIPEFLGSFTKLEYLSLSNASFSGPIPYQLSNLSRLRVLDLSYCDLSKAIGWVQILSQLPSLQTLHLDHCNLPTSVPTSVSLVKSSFFHLVGLNLRGNNLTSHAVYPWLFNHSLEHLAYLDLSLNHLEGPVTEAIGNLTSLAYLYLDGNQLEDGIPISFQNLCNLSDLTMASNNLWGDMSTDFLQSLPRCKRSPLRSLDLSYNQITGSLPDQITKFPSLDVLFLRSNRLNGTITKHIGQISDLRYIDLSRNSLSGIISEAHFVNLSSLDALDLSYNSNLFLNFSFNWFPPFKYVDYLLLGSCQLGPRFPTWLRSLCCLKVLDISAAGISDTIPYWFWDVAAPVCLLNISRNQISGHLPNLSSKFGCEILTVDFSSNLLQGSLPNLPSVVMFLILSNNNFSGSASSICEITNHKLQLLDLSNNQLSGTVPNCFMQWPWLKILNLADNNLCGPIPASMGSLVSLQVLDLHNNNFSGRLPVSFNCTSLVFLDLSNNALSGAVPNWLKHNSQSLVFLSLRANHFNGPMPREICGLRNVRVLDLSLNVISGSIPKCINNLIAMTNNQNLTSEIKLEYSLEDPGQRTFYFDGGIRIISRYYISKALLVWQGQEREYEKNLGYMILLDFSSNMLTGEIPREITFLSQLVTLNLSRNFLNGTIPLGMGQLRQLEVLDLSHNQLSGNIPSTLSELTFLDKLNLAYNKLSGRIPASTQIDGFEASAFAGNLALCGRPVKLDCPGDIVPQSQPRSDKNYLEDEFDENWFYVGMGCGFAAALWGFCGMLLLKPSLGSAYFRLLDSLVDWL